VQLIGEYVSSTCGSGHSYSYSFYASRNILLVHKLKERKIVDTYIQNGVGTWLTSCMMHRLITYICGQCLDSCARQAVM
jgi:hypothetical protein